MAIRSNVLTPSRNTNKATEQKPFEGCWINVGVTANVEDDNGNETTTLVKLPMGIPVATLVDRKIYQNTSPEVAEQIMYLNGIMDLIREKANSLAPGESAPLKLAVEVYRKQDEAEVAETPKADREVMASRLFG